jgi:hypothetical protein
LDQQIYRRQTIFSFEKQVVETARECRRTEQRSEIGNHATSDVLNGMVEYRRNLQPGCDNKEERLTLSKQIQKEVRRLLKTKKREQIAERLTKSKELRSLAGIRAGGKWTLLHSDVHQSGRVRTDRQEIVDVFADFYASLYARPEINHFGKRRWADGPCEPVAAFTVAEAMDQLRKMARNKSADDSGLVVEMLQEASEQLLQTTVEVFN